VELRTPLAVAALALLLAAAALPPAAREGSAAAAPTGDAVRCVRFAGCFFHDPGDLVVVVHASAGLALDEGGRAALARHVADLTGRGVRFEAGSTLPELDAVVGDADLRTLPAWDTEGGGLHLLLVNATRHEGAEPTSGLSFPGSSRLYLFPGALDGRVEAAAELSPAQASGARATLESVVLAHELGHALGLVGCGAPEAAAHADPGSACHSANLTSIMHRHVARVDRWPPGWDPANPLGPFGWDATDRADLAALREATRPPSPGSVLS
jgi:hypothetical protein